MEPPTQRSAAPADAPTPRLLTPDPLRTQWARSHRLNCLCSCYRVGSRWQLRERKRTGSSRPICSRSRYPPRSLRKERGMPDEVKPYPLITDAIRRDQVEQVASLFDRYPEMEGLRVPAFGTWLHYAAAHSSASMLAWLVARGFDPCSMGGPEGETPVEMAAVNGRDENVSFFLGLGVPLDTSTAIRNPLFSAVLSRSLKVSQLLLEAGIDTSPRYSIGSSGQTLGALGFAMLHGARDIARAIALHSNGGDVGLADEAMADGLDIAVAIGSDSAN